PDRLRNISLAALRQSLLDPDPLVRVSATAVLARRGDPQAMDLFRNALADSDYGIRSAAARTLGDFYPTTVTDDPALAHPAAGMLIPLLRDKSARVRPTDGKES
ncbi:MAG TPA: HEAT repeat domain-containing protein, partial [Nitrospiria bacterium]